jgi:hypothetical protein
VEIATIGLIITFYSAGIATLAAAQKYREFSRKLKVTFSVAVYPHSGGVKRAFSLSCTNEGRRPITVTSYGLLMLNNKVILIPWYPESPCRLPATLGDGQNCLLLFSREAVTDVLKEAGYTREVYLKPFFGDSSGKRHFSKKVKIQLEQ